MSTATATRTEMGDSAPPGSVLVIFRGDLPAEAAVEKVSRALLQTLILHRSLMKSMEGSEGVHRFELIPPPGTDLKQLARGCSTAVKDAFRRQGVHTDWSLSLVDDQGRVYEDR